MGTKQNFPFDQNHNTDSHRSIEIDKNHIHWFLIESISGSDRFGENMKIQFSSEHSMAEPFHYPTLYRMDGNMVDMIQTKIRARDRLCFSIEQRTNIKSE